ncbi:MAG: phosphatidylglycerol lysyltransferase domain-containing protein [Kineosporiaceae bacterium]
MSTGQPAVGAQAGTPEGPAEDLERSPLLERADKLTRAWRPRIPRVVAWMVRLAALYSVLGLLSPESRLARSRTGEVVFDALAYVVAAAGAAAMLVLATALTRRKRRAWRLLVVAVGIGTLAHVRTERYSVAALYLVLLAVLVWARRDFTALSDPSSRFVVLRVFLVSLAVAVGVGLLLSTRTAPEAAWGDRLVEVLSGLVGFAPVLTYPHPGWSQVTQLVLAGLGSAVALLTLLAFLAPPRHRQRALAADQERLRELLERHGERDSLGYFALRDDKAAVFSRSGKAAVVYRVVGGVTLASGDPLGDPEAWPQAIAEWLAEAKAHAWTPGVIGCSEAAALAYTRMGFDAFELGDEAVLDLTEFSLEGRSMRGVRQAVNRVRRAGYTAEVTRQRDLDDAARAELATAAEALRGGDVERGFSMALGRIGEAVDPDLVVTRVRDDSGALVAVLTYVPWGRDGLSLDVMRRSRGSENGTVEFAVAALVEAVKPWGVTRVSLNFAVFRSAFERGSKVGAGPVLRVWRQALLFASRWWQIESLYRANAKYEPQWQPRFLCFERASDLPRVAVAALEAEAFLTRPRLRWLAR